MRFIFQLTKTFLITTGIALSFSAYAQNAPDISGTYICKGNDTTDKTDYAVELTVTKKGDILEFKGKENGIGGSTRKNFSGTGMFAKDSSTIFGAEFWQDNDPTKAGVIINQLKTDGSWEGIWTWKDKPGINTEECKKKQ